MLWLPSAAGQTQESLLYFDTRSVLGPRLECSTHWFLLREGAASPMAPGGPATGPFPSCRCTPPAPGKCGVIAVSTLGTLDLGVLARRLL